MPTPTVDFIFNELILEMDYIKAMDGLAAGTFISMYGDEVTFAVEDLPEYITNTMRVIKSTKTESGQIVGLPIDQDAHDHMGGAGWIIGLELDEARSVIRFTVNWTEIGLELIAKNIRRFFSPSVDIFNKVILGGSLTNYPATRDAAGRILLRPIELSQSMKEISMPTFIEQLENLFTKYFGSAPPTPPTQTTPPAVPPPAPPVAPVTTPPVDLSNVPNPSLQSLYQDPAEVDTLDANVQTMVAQRVNAEMRKRHTESFVAELIGGTKNKPYGFAVKSKDLIAWMLSLTDAQAKFAERILSEMRNKAIDFAERGFEGNEGFISLPSLPENILPFAREWMKTEGNTIESFFAANPEIGKIADFNVAEFRKVTV